ncbi:hypothetical protein CJF43_12345 [Pseudomonas fragi]|uniref:Toxin n=1 Tax=Pseudomonas fragi TaxID=296 RepID=A0A266LU22_PSEFR|nr:neuraminidase-like domain-containing protein [Pseudomonas fragi]OZY41543.1 hypothetical protein CJF43_12345 [Pseudomonas fragi]
MHIPLHQQLNEQLRDAMLALYLTYVLPQDRALQASALNNKINNADDLYAYWLLDVQVSQAVPTSRVASAIASLQQYINAISMGLEPGYEQQGMTPAQQTTWNNSLHAYSLWRTAQQLRHYPANYLNPMLRSQKTESFLQLENDINQCRIQSDDVLPAIQRYLTRFEEISTLKTINGYIDGDKDHFAESTYYFIARSNVDNTLFWRSLDMSRRGLHSRATPAHPFKQDAPQPGAWSEWKRIPLPTSEDIPEHSIRPVYFNNRLFVVWAQCTSPTASGSSATFSEAKNDESEKDYKARLDTYLKSNFIQLRLYFAHMKGDGSWSAPQLCSNEYFHTKGFGKLSHEALKQDLQTIAVLDSTTHPPSLFLGLNAHAPQLTKPGLENISSDYFQAVRVDPDFVMTRLHSKGTLEDPKPEAEHEKIANRYLSMFIYNHTRNHTRNFDYRPSASEIVGVDKVSASTPDPVPDGWNFNDMHGHISDLAHRADIAYNKTSCALEVTSRLAKAFPEHRTVSLRGSNNWAELDLELKLHSPLTNGTDLLALEKDSRLTIKLSGDIPCSWISLSITCHKSSLVFASLFHDSANDPVDMTRPQLATKGKMNWEVFLEGKFIAHDTFNFLFENTNTDYSITLRYHRETNLPADPDLNWIFDNVKATLYARHYKPVIMTARDENTPHPHQLHRTNSYIVGEPNRSRREMNATSTSLRVGHTFSAHIQLTSQALRPYEERSNPPTQHLRPITIIHGVLILDVDTRNNDRTIQGYALKALTLTLDAGNAAPVTPIAPRIIRKAAQFDGTAELIDFSRSVIQYSDDASTQTPRAPIRMNTSVARRMSAAASVSLQHLFSMTASQWREPGFEPDEAPQALDFHGAHGKYFWELFLYLPWLVACRLNMEQRYAEAQSWLKYLFDPQSSPTDQQQPDYWKLHALSQEQPATGYPQDNSNDPHQIALGTPLYFRQALYMLYLDILLNRGDSAYRQASADSLAEARLWYMRASSLLGPLAQITRADPWQPATLEDLGTSSRNELCQPLNPDLVARRDKLDSRLYNLRHHLSISGKPLRLELFAPALAVHALSGNYLRSTNPAAGSVTNLQTAQTGHYRFQVIHAHASALVENVVQLGNTLLLLFERKEHNDHQLLQQQQAWDLAKIAVEQQHQSLRADEASHGALVAGRHAIEGRLHYFENLLAEGISAVEAQASQHYLESAKWDTRASTAEAAAGVAMLLPNIFGTSNGGMRYEGALYAVQAVARSTANEKRANAAHLDRTALFNRRAQEWSHALEQCRLELNQVDLQLQTHMQQSAMLRLQLKHAETAMEQARLSYQMLNKRFTSAELYQWLNSHLADFYYQAYDAAYSLCLTAQACWQFERADWNTGFIQTSHWNSQFKGLTAGESLKLDLQQMKTAYIQGNRRELEISKTVSLRLLHGKDRLPTLNKDWATLKNQMTSQGTLDFELSKALYDDDYPGHYLRRIKSVSVSLPATLGPYEDIRATLTQTWNQTHLSATDNAPLENMRVREQVALSTGLNDNGLFTLNFDTDERYLPFEYTGAVSRWRLAFPNPAAQADMLNSLSDIIVHVRYTARSAGGQG